VRDGLLQGVQRRPDHLSLHSFAETPDGNASWGLQESDQLARFNIRT
jgi:hypothetical protein